MSFVPRIFINEKLEINREYKIIDKQYHYLSNVLRCQIDDDIILINGKDGEFYSKIIKLNNKFINLKIIKKNKEYFKQNFLGLIIPFIQKIDIVLKSATEIGVTDFFFIKTEYSKSNIKNNKIEGNIIEAVEQSERLDIPNIHNIQTLEILLDKLNKKENLILFSEERSNNNFFKDIYKNINFDNKKIYILIGPEGGFSIEEKKKINSYNNVISINLGENILRTETATISMLSLVKNIVLI